MDQSRVDPGDILCVVLSVEDEQFYKLGNRYGILPQMFTRNQFTVCPKKLLSIDKVSKEEKSLVK
jgi:hypothetical protein